MLQSTAETPNEVALVAAAAALLPIPAKQSQICTPIFAADIDSSEKGIITTTTRTTTPLEMKRSSAPKTSKVPAPPIGEAEKRAEQTAASSTAINRHAEIGTVVDRAMEEPTGQKASGGN
jgi:hypothetical protein